MKELRSYTFIFLLILLCACTKVNDLLPRDFGVGEENISTNSITIRWSESTDPENSIVKYKVLFAEKDSEDYTLDSYNITETQFPERSREFFFFQSVSNLKLNTEYKGKVEAFDQDGSETEDNFSSKTNADEFYPIIVVVKLSVYRFSANIYINLMASENL